jgi:ABC-2 type transport system ATP-binding protein
LIQELSAEGVTVFVTTHYMDEAEYCNRLALILQGRLIALGTPNQLKLHSVQGDLLAIEAAPLGRALELVKAAGGVRDAAVFGNALHLVVDDADQALPTMQAAMEAGGVQVRRIARIRPSLEDAFVALTGDERDGFAAPASEVRPEQP